jgi:hypothetical protein
MDRLGRMRREEIVTAIVIGAAILTWATQPGIVFRQKPSA